MKKFCDDKHYVITALIGTPDHWGKSTHYMGISDKGKTTWVSSLSNAQLFETQEKACRTFSEYQTELLFEKNYDIDESTVFVALIAPWPIGSPITRPNIKTTKEPVNT